MEGRVETGAGCELAGKGGEGSCRQGCHEEKYTASLATQAGLILITGITVMLQLFSPCSELSCCTGEPAPAVLA
jgi:hypothetical protein